jgi:RNA polymerase sigma factor (sigma-70 family)
MGQSPHNQEKKARLEANRARLEQLACAYLVSQDSHKGDLVLDALEPLVRHKSRRCAYKSIHPVYRAVEEEDAAQVARLAIFKALSTWKPERAKFSTWVHQCINNALRELLDVARRKPEHVEMAEWMEPSAPMMPLDSIEARDLRAAIDRLPEREALVIKQYFFEQRTLEEIGQQLGISQSRVGQLRDRALELLKRYVPHLDDTDDLNADEPG